MVLRVIQIFVPQSSEQTLEELLEGCDVLGRWRDTDAGLIVLHLLVPAEETEPIMDRFEQQYADAEGFHVILLPVEAVLPRPKPEPEADEEAAPADTKNETNGSQRISREELYTEVSEGLGVSRVFMGMVFLSAVVAAVGLLRNDVAVIIGAMVIAPLLGPNVAMSLATTLGDFELLRRALVTNVTGLGAAFGLGFIAGPAIGGYHVSEKRWQAPWTPRCLPSLLGHMLVWETFCSHWRLVQRGHWRLPRGYPVQ